MKIQLPRHTRHHLLAHAEQLVAAVPRPAGEVWASELGPLLDAARFLEKQGPKLLKPRKAAGPTSFAFRHLRPEVRRAPLGTVLIIAPFNYPLFLPGSQCLQALAAGNRVIWKPGRQGLPVALAMREALRDAGLAADRLEVTDESIEAGTDAIRQGVDLVIFTGSAHAARAVASLAAEQLTPCILEASGCDAMFILEQADLDLAARALWFGLGINHGQTCISPRRIFVPRRAFDDLIERLGEHAPAAKQASKPLPQAVLDQAAALIEEGGEKAPILFGGAPEAGQMSPTLLGPLAPEHSLCRSDLFAPLCGLIPYDDPAELPRLDRESPYALGASIFGPVPAAQKLAQQLDAGNVTINDLIAPTGDARVSFGGGKLSGYGRTRGASGLLACTREQSIVTARGSFRPHLKAGIFDQIERLRGLVSLSHAPGLRKKMRALKAIIKG